MLGFKPNLIPQNDDVYWTILICFSIAPVRRPIIFFRSSYCIHRACSDDVYFYFQAVFSLMGALVLLAYPKGARRPEALDTIQDGIVLHAAGKEAFDPITRRIAFAPQVIQAAVGGQGNEAIMQHFFKCVVWCGVQPILFICCTVSC